MNAELGTTMRRDMARRLCLFGFDEIRVVDRLMQRLEMLGDAPAPRTTLTTKESQTLDERARRAVAEFSANEATKISNEPARIAFTELGHSNPARVELDDIDDRELYDGFDLSDAEVS
jgi:hypothetical protein